MGEWEHLDGSMDCKPHQCDDFGCCPVMSIHSLPPEVKKAIGDRNCLTLAYCTLDLKSIYDNKADWDWCGKLERRFVWSKFKFETGRWCYQTNAFGDTLRRGWKPEKIMEYESIKSQD